MVLLFLIFLATLLPYLLLALFSGAQDFFWLIFIWSLFFALVSYLPKWWAGLTPIVTGVMLAFPLSSFVYIGSDGHLTFYLTHQIREIQEVIPQLACCLFLTGSAYYLVRSIRDKGQTF
jgi:hypothetical protein